MVRAAARQEGKAPEARSDGGGAGRGEARGGRAFLVRSWRLRCVVGASSVGGVALDQWVGDGFVIYGWAGFPGVMKVTLGQS